jgi:hypothetical protein
MRSRIRHELKTWPEFFAATKRGHKKFELRRDDRGGFQVGDELLLKEWDPLVADTHYSHTSNTEEAIQVAYTGQEVLLRVDYVMPVETVEKLMDLSGTLVDPKYGFVIMSVSPVITEKIILAGKGF